ncbi:MAG: DNA/RNA non-specific endonuclease [Bacteroidetes bacterium 38_7]|nr:MAG: DNA/RNA non-specific endonuclease [Bacteroidetes bacterium 38_7]HAL64015.1 DNA/RNA non-specific endonuclease [Bacteroidales bacterium]
MLRELLRKIIILFILFWKANSLAQPNIWCIPAHADSDLIIQYTGFTLKYNKIHKVSEWVAYDLVPYKLIKTAKRSNRFVPDPHLPRDWSAHPDDYKYSGFDRGHLAPAADMAWSAQAMEESFYLSNICPQQPQFNRISWKKLEDNVRQWARLYDTLLIVTGPILSTDLPKIGKGKVSVPANFFKAVVIYTHHKKSGIAFIMQNKYNLQPPSAITIDSLERLTGFNFFAKLPENEQNQIEGHIIKEDWTMP